MDANFDSHFKDLFENTSDLIYFLSLDGVICLANPAWLAVLDYEPADAIGKSIYDFIHPRCIEEYKKVRRIAINEKCRKDVATTFLTRHGKEVVAEGHVVSTYESGNPSYTRGVFKNVTSRKIAEKKLEDSEKRLKTFFSSAPDAVIVINQEQEIIEWNPKAEVIFGYAADEVMAKPLADIIIPFQYREAHEKGMQHFLKTGEGPVLNNTIEITALHKNGYEFYIDLSISNVKMEGTWVFIAFISDISERKKTEQNLIFKEAELLQARLLEEKKDEFISIASHELRTPLTTIKAYSQILLDLSKEGTYAPFHGYLDKVDQCADKLNALLSELFDVSRIHAGKLSISRTDVAFDAFFTEVVGSMQHIIPTHNIVIEKNESCLAQIDVLRMEQVISNIINNAAKYSPGKKKIIVNSEKNDDTLTISFEDFGIGIPEEKIDKIFERFYRVDQTLRRFSGFGIGLYVSSEIIKQHGGKIWAQSKLGRGSTFYVSIPLSGHKQ